MLTKRPGVLLGLMVSVGLFVTPAHAQVNINVQIGEPPPVVVYAPPTMVLMPEPQMYVAVGVPYDIFFASGALLLFPWRPLVLGTGIRWTVDLRGCGEATSGAAKVQDEAVASIPRARIQSLHRSRTEIRRSLLRRRGER